MIALSFFLDNGLTSGQGAGRKRCLDIFEGGPKSGLPLHSSSAWVSLTPVPYSGEISDSKPTIPSPFSFNTQTVVTN